jgi:serine/threonine-protein kinase HipA
MHRFDREVTAEGVGRIAVESMYSLSGVSEPGSYIVHSEVLKNLIRLWQSIGQGEQVGDLVFEYVQRDLLNQLFGNSDNHGRNMSILRSESGVKLAPIYDLASMVMDEEGVTGTATWPRHIELSGEVNWRAACAEMSEWVNPDELFERLRTAAQSLLALPDLLSDEGLPVATMNHPRIALHDLPKRLGKWELI